MQYQEGEGSRLASDVVLSQFFRNQLRKIEIMFLKWVFTKVQNAYFEFHECQDSILFTKLVLILCYINNSAEDLERNLEGFSDSYNKWKG